MADKPQTVTEFYAEHKQRGGHDNDDVLIDKIAEAFPIDPPPRVVVRHVVPRGFEPVSEDISEYHTLMRDADFDLVREKMLAELRDEEREAADNLHSEFNWQYRRFKEALVQEREAAQAERAKAEATKKWYKDRMQTADPAKRADWEARYLEKFVKL